VVPTPHVLPSETKRSANERLRVHVIGVAGRGEDNLAAVA
jgi:hypothetical protein